MVNADVVWMLVSTALVLLMTPALGFFYGGMVRSKNALNTLMMSFAALGPVAVMWAVAGYSLAFSPGTPFVGGFGYLGLRGVTLEAQGTIPHLLFMAYQGTFAIITPALISGAVVERMRFKAYLLFVVIWGLLVYAPVAHWVWGGGFLPPAAALDFAGGAVVHVNAAAAALVAAVVVGPRKDYGRRAMLPHSVPFTLLGAGLLWFGWFGFNAGSALGANGLASVAFVNTNTAAAAATLVWMILDQITKKEITALGAASGAVAGLVGITPAAGFVSPMGSIAVGGLTSLVCFFAANWRAKSKLDDSLDAFAVHGVGGATGAILTGIFCTTAYNSASAKGLLEGNAGQLIIQLEATIATALYTMVMTFIILKVLGAIMGLRVDEESEERGLDIAEHGEEAYSAVGI